MYDEFKNDLSASEASDTATDVSEVGDSLSESDMSMSKADFYSADVLDADDWNQANDVQDTSAESLSKEDESIISDWDEETFEDADLGADNDVGESDTDMSEADFSSDETMDADDWNQANDVQDTSAESLSEADESILSDWDEETFEDADLGGDNQLGDAPTEAEEPGRVLELKRDPNEAWLSGNRAIDSYLEVMRDDLRYKGWPEGPELEAMVMAEKPLLMDELQRSIEGDYSNPYPGFNFPKYPGESAQQDTYELQDQSTSDDTTNNPGDMDASITDDNAAEWTDEASEDADTELMPQTDTPDSLDRELPQDLVVNDTDDVLETSDSNDLSDFLVAETGETADLAPDAQEMNDVSEWLGYVNPNYDAFDPNSPYCNNCGSCALSVYQRLEGLDPSACASADNIGYNSEMEDLTGMKQVPMSPEEIEQTLLAQGEGAHAIIGIDRYEGAGHWFNAACMNGRVVAIDGQSGELLDWPPDYGDISNWEMSVKE